MKWLTPSFPVLRFYLLMLDEERLWTEMKETRSRRLRMFKKN